MFSLWIIFSIFAEDFNNMEKDFETLWKENKKRILEADPEYRKIIDSYKMNSGADWLLFALPAVVAIIILDWNPFQRELVNWLIGAIAAIVTFALCVWIKSIISGNRSLDEVEKEIKNRCLDNYNRTGNLE